MPKKILITGRTGSGKTTLARALAPLIHAVVFDGDEVRAADPMPLGFSETARYWHAVRMGFLCNCVTASGNNVIASFVCPTEKLRHAFQADYTVHCGDRGDGKYPDTQTMWENPVYPDLTVTHKHPPDYWARLIAAIVEPATIFTELCTREDGHICGVLGTCNGLPRNPFQKRRNIP